MNILGTVVLCKYRDVIMVNQSDRSSRRLVIGHFSANGWIDSSPVVALLCYKHNFGSVLL